MRFLPGREDWRVAVVGLGFVGSCLAAALADRGLDVVGIDVDPRLIAELDGGYCRFREDELGDLLAGVMAAGRLRVTTDYAAAGAADVVLIAVGTPVRDDGSLAADQLSAACAELSRYVREGQLIILKSTVPPGTTRSLVLPLLEHGGLYGSVDFGLAFMPERLAEGTALRELRAFPMVAGGPGRRQHAGRGAVLAHRARGAGDGTRLAGISGDRQAGRQLVDRPEYRPGQRTRQVLRAVRRGCARRHHRGEHDSQGRWPRQHLAAQCGRGRIVPDQGSLYGLAVGAQCGAWTSRPR